MPFNFNQFMTFVRNGNPHYERIKDSSLHQLVQLLQNPNLNTLAIRNAMQMIPDAKKRKYTAAFTYLQNNLTNVNALNQHNQLPVAAAVPVGARTIVAGIPCSGYSIISDPEHHTDVLINREGPLNRAQITQLNVTIKTARDAVEKAILEINTLNGNITPPGATLTQRLYLNYFGNFDLTRRNMIRRNFMSIQQAIDGDRGGTQGSLQIIDARNDAGKQNWFAAAFRGAGTPRNGVVTQIQLYVGRPFFQPASYRNAGGAIDNTIGTIVHELSHACFNASDVPTVAAGGRAGLVNGMPPTGGTVCNDAASDRALAADDPEAALLNADNYGQFAWRLSFNQEPTP